MKSAFKFLSYKIDNIKFEILRELGLLEFNQGFSGHPWEISIGIREPLFFKAAKKYVGGLDTVFLLKTPEEKDKGATEVRQLVKIEIGIAGVFAVEEEKFEKTVEDQLVLIQIPAILFPYLRSAVTSILANSGFGSVILPLINIHAVAKDFEGKLTIKEID
jgi:preprotein translocase subunit SecB